MATIKLPKFKIKKPSIDWRLTLKHFLIFLLRSLQWLVIIIAWVLYIGSYVAMFVVPYWIVIYPLLILIIRIIIKIKHMQFLNYAEGNTIIHGGRGKGKGILFQYLALKQSEILSNVYFGTNTIITDPKQFFESIKPNTSKMMVEGTHQTVIKNDKWEGVPYLLDDTAVYFPNYLDNLLKSIYPSMSLMIPIQRHLYDSWTCLNVQDIERVYKVLRELQTDGYIKALKTMGKGYIWNRLPVLRKYMFTKWRYHEKIDSAINNVLPFSKLGLINRTSDPLYTTTASAMKEVYEGQNGVIVDGFIFLKKKHIYYDTRYFHKVLFGYSAPNPILLKTITKKEKK